MKLDPALLEIIVCPDCKGELSFSEEDEELTCTSCGLVYDVKDGFPALLVHEARRPSGNA